MAGPGIRYYNFALELAKNFEVTLMVPSPVDFEVESFDVVQAQAFGGRAFGEYVKKFDVLITQALLPWTMRALANQPVRVIYDLYDPLLVGNLALFAKHRSSPGTRTRSFVPTAWRRRSRSRLETRSFVRASANGTSSLACWARSVDSIRTSTQATRRFDA
jgi:hypothetical protein